jgi:hypothetical protein
MSTAILISGQMRTFAQCYLNQKWQVFRRFTNPHFFITVQDNAEAASIDLLRRDYGESRVHVELRTDPVLEVTPAMEQGWVLAPYQNAAPAHQLLLQHWYQNEVWKNFQSWHPDSPDHAFDAVVRIRPDQWFHSFHAGPFVPFSSLALTPWWGRFGGINDRLAILGPDAAKAYFTVYEQIPALLAAGCAFHPESLVHAALEKAGCDIMHKLASEFSTIRLDGKVRLWMSEVLPCDVPPSD